MNKKILIIDDDASSRQLLDVLLRQQYETYTHTLAIDALLWLSYGNIPDLILLDMSMPQLSGNHFLRSIRTSGFYRHIPVILLSGSEAQNEIDEALQLGIHGFVRKPFKPIELRSQISSVLSQNLVSTHD